MRLTDIQEAAESPVRPTSKFLAKVSGRLVPVRLLGGPVKRGYSQRPHFHAVNTVTDRNLMISAVRLRAPVYECLECRRWFAPKVQYAARYREDAGRPCPSCVIEREASKTTD